MFPVLVLFLGFLAFSFEGSLGGGAGLRGRGRVIRQADGRPPTISYQHGEEGSIATASLHHFPHKKHSHIKDLSSFLLASLYLGWFGVSSFSCV